MASTYCDKLLSPFLRVWAAQTLTQQLRIFVRIITEYQLHSDLLPTPSIHILNESSSYPEAGVHAYRRSLHSDKCYIDVENGDITYVLEYNPGLCSCESGTEFL